MAETQPPSPGTGAVPQAAPPPEPDRVQLRALGAMHEHLGGSGRAVVVLPPASGKTLLGRWFAAQLGARLTVVFVPSLALVPQTVLDYRSDRRWPHQTLIVCSDPTSGRAVALHDLNLPSWVRASVTASTSQRVVEEFLAGGGPPRVIVSTYHSAPRVAAALQDAGYVADLAVNDEAHRLAGRPRAEFRAVLDERALPARRRLFLTATPVEAAAWQAEADDDVAAPLSLDDEATFGPTIYRGSYADGIAVGRLVDYDVEVLARRRDTPANTRAGGAQPGAAAAVQAAIRAGCRHVLTFHTRVGSARHLAGALDGTRIGRVPVHAEHLESRHSATHRGDALARLAAPPVGAAAVLTSARTISEGVNVPCVDAVVFAEPRTSPVDIVQAVGRATRAAPGKTRGRIILAVGLGDAGLDEDTALSGTHWRHVWVTLRALASMDPRFAARLRQQLQPDPDRDPQRTPPPGPGLRVDLPEGLSADRWILRALDRTGGSWWTRYDLLAAHARQHGSARPSADACRAGAPIGRWVIQQRTRHSQGVLEPDRADALEKLPGWAWSARDIAWWGAAAAWEKAMATRRWRPDVAGDWEHLLVTSGWAYSRATAARPASAYANLAEFVVDTCSRRRRGELPGFLETAAARLPGWRWEVVPGDDARLVDALAEYGAWRQDLNPPHDYRHDGDLPLGAWVTALRRRRYTGRLHPALEAELTVLGHGTGWAPLRWEAADTGWRLGYLALRQYVAREGKARMPQHHHETLPDPHELDLSRWCTVQRQQHRLGQMPPERVTALEQVPGWEWEIGLREGYRPVLAEATHGTRRGYAKGCKCDPCTAANSTYEHARTNGATTDLVDARPARGHLRLLLGRGAGQKELARAADVNVKTVVEVAEGIVARIRPETEEALLALTFEAAAEHAAGGRWGETVDAAPTWALIDWMVLRGWPKGWIGRELGQSGRALQLHRGRIAKTTADKVADLDRRLGRSRRPPARGSNRAGTRPGLPTLAEILAAEEATADARSPGTSAPNANASSSA